MTGRREDMELLKVPPQNLEAEQAVLGAMMLEPEVGSSVFEMLQPEDFYRDNHRLIFSAIRDLFEKGDPIDLVSVAEILRQQGRLEQVGRIELCRVPCGGSNEDKISRRPLIKEFFNPLRNMGVTRIIIRRIEGYSLILEHFKQFI
jgi:hypothetical protein